MKHLMFLIVFFWALSGCSQTQSNEPVWLTVSPVIDTTDTANKRIIDTLKGFLKSKNEFSDQNRYWIKSDFDKYRYPYLDIYGIEGSRYGKDFYKPTLMEIISTNDARRKVLKIAWVGHLATTGENQIKIIYNIIATTFSSGTVLFSSYLDYATEDWTTIRQGSITYKLPPGKVASKSQMAQQARDIFGIQKFFNAAPIPFTYYSCTDPIQLFRIKGFDYKPGMYTETSGGLAEWNNIIFSGNNAELYTHEVVHLYANKINPAMHPFLSEGLASCIGGSSMQNYPWHREKLKRFLAQSKDYDPAAHTDPFEAIYFEHDTSIPYFTAALILERTFRLYGKAGILALLKSEGDLWSGLNRVGLTRQNVKGELIKELSLPVRSIF